MGWQIRHASTTDADAFALIGAATFLATFADVHTGAEIIEHCTLEHSVTSYSRLLCPPTDAWLVETAETAAPVGYAVLTEPELSASTDGDLELKRIYLLPSYQGTGAGAALMQTVIDRARGRGAKRLVLGVYSGNARALAYYSKHGFTRIGDHRFQVGAAFYDDFILALPLG